MQYVKDYQNHAICVYSIKKTVKIPLNEHVVGKKTLKFLINVYVVDKKL